MAEKQFTAEEKLLNIIEHGMEHVPPRQPATGRRTRLPHVSSLGRERLKELLGLRSVNWILAFLCVAATGFWALDCVRSQAAIEKRARSREAETPLDGQAVKPRGLLASVPALPELVFESNRRNIFSLSQDQAQGAAGVLVDYDALMRNYRLVGIFWTEDSPQAMIENSQDGKTGLFSEKDRIGEFTIRKIAADKVVVGKDDKEWELR